MTKNYRAGECIIKVIVNSDWSGDAIVSWNDITEVVIPGLVLKAICKVESRKILDQKLSKLLDMIVDSE